MMIQPSRSLRVSRRARNDFRRILQYSLRTWGEAQRDAYEARLNRAFRELVAYPELGRPRDELRSGVRSLPVEQHIVFYRVADDEILVVRILHAKMEPVRRL